MAARVIHFGIDCYHRLDVLERAGYEVVRTELASELKARLQDEVDFHAVVISETEEMDVPGVVDTVRAATEVPIMLFRCTARWIDERKLSWVVESTDRPDDLLRGLAMLIAQFRIRQIAD